MANAISWFEIPASNFDRARQFYSTIFEVEMPILEIQDSKMAMFPATEDGVGGAVCTGEFHTPSSAGTIPYLNGGDDLSTVLNRVEPAGGQITMPKTMISEEIGYMALFHDTEGNRVALFSRS
jgi:predicted enzyme related to lactoylglutathione lyase